jgi:hypothetical protein
MFLYVINCFNETRPTECPFTPWVVWLLDHSVLQASNAIWSFLLHSKLHALVFKVTSPNFAQFNLIWFTFYRSLILQASNAFRPVLLCSRLHALVSIFTSLNLILQASKAFVSFLLDIKPHAFIYTVTSALLTYWNPLLHKAEWWRYYITSEIWSSTILGCLKLWDSQIWHQGQWYHLSTKFHEPISL